MNDKMDANLERMDANTQALRGDMRTQRGEMQCVGLSLQANLKEVSGEMRTVGEKMAAPRGGATELTRGSANCVGPQWRRVRSG